jgi:hypothetical protein
VTVRQRRPERQYRRGDEADKGKARGARVGSDTKKSGRCKREGGARRDKNKKEHKKIKVCMNVLSISCMLKKKVLCDK